MTRINDLTATAVTNPQSVELWVVYNGKDYRMSVSELAKTTGRAFAFMLVNANTPYGHNVGSAFQFTSAYYDIGGWWNSSSNGMVRAPNSLVTKGTFKFAYQWYWAREEILSLYKNGTLVETPGGFSFKDETLFDNSTTELIFPEVSISSGDRFEVKTSSQGVDPSTVLAVKTNFFTMEPTEFLT